MNKKLINDGKKIVEQFLKLRRKKIGIFSIRIHYSRKGIRNAGLNTSNINYDGDVLWWLNNINRHI